MLITQFFAQDLHFVVSLFAALAFFAVFWLMIDAWSLHKEWKEFFKALGFLLLALSFLLYAAVIEQTSFGHVSGAHLLEVSSRILRIIAYGSIIFGLLIDPLQPIPEVEGLNLGSPSPPDDNDSKKTPLPAAGFVLGKLVWVVFLPLGSLACALLYWRRAHKGLENHLKPVAISFLWLSLFEVFSLGMLWQDTTNPLLYHWVQPFGYLWIAAHILLFIGSAWIAIWVWKYLVKRLQSQLFMVFTSLGVAIFAFTTISFTYLLMHNIENEAYKNLRTAAQVLDYALDSKKAETLANAESFQNQALASAVSARDRKQITTLLGSGLVDKKLSSLVVTSSSGQVLLKAEDPSNWGQSISSDALVRRALLGTEASGVISRDGVLSPNVVLRGAVPIRDAQQRIVGVIIAERVIDNSFVDGIKNATGLDTAVYGGSTRASTTLISSDGHSRWVGIKETNKGVIKTVLDKGKTYSGSLTVLNKPFLAVYSPLKDANNGVVGMLFIGQPRISLLETVAWSIELTFIVAISLIFVLIFPAFLMAKRISKQLE
jgi:hypothetical protein